MAGGGGARGGAGEGRRGGREQKPFTLASAAVFLFFHCSMRVIVYMVSMGWLLFPFTQNHRGKKALSRFFLSFLGEPVGVFGIKSLKKSESSHITAAPKLPTLSLVCTETHNSSKCLV